MTGLRAGRPFVNAPMLHATRMVLHTFAEQDSGRTPFVGAGTAGQLLEIVVKDARDDTEPEIVHAMSLRRGSYKYL